MLFTNLKHVNKKNFIPDTYSYFFFWRYTTPPPYCQACRSNVEFEQEWYQIAQYSFCSRYRTCLDIFSNLYTEC